MIGRFIQLPALRVPRGPRPVDGRSRWLVLAVVGLGQLMVVLDATIVNIALPSAQHDLAASNADRQWVVTAYSLAFGGLLLAGGRLADLVGRRRTFLTGLIGFALASAVGGAAPNIGTLIAARAVQGGFGALLAPAALTILTTTFAGEREQARAMSIYTAIAGSGGAIGLLLGGVLTEYASWRWCLYVNIAFAALALVGALAVLSDQPHQSGLRIDIVGGVLAIAGLVAIVDGLAEASTGGWADPVTLSLIIGGLAMLAVFALVERTVSEPLLPPSIPLHRVRGTAYLGMIVGGLAVFGMFLVTTFYFQDVRHYSPLASGFAFLPFVGGVTVGAALVSSRALPKLGPKIVVPTGMVLAAAGTLCLALVGHNVSYLVVAIGLILVGLGGSAVLVPGFSLGPNGAPPQHAGVASALVNSSNQIGGSVGAALLNTVAASAAASYVSHHGSGSLAAAVVHGDSVAYTVLAAVLVGGAAITGTLFPRRLQPLQLASPRQLVSPPPQSDDGDSGDVTHPRTCGDRVSTEPAGVCS